MSKITLNNVANLLDTTTSQTTINNNSSTVQTAFDNTLSRDGTSPNQMLSNIDMNQNQILNLPAPATTNSPVRLQDLNTLQSGGTITPLPTGGTTNQALTKHSATNYDVQWSNVVTSVGLSLPADLTVTGSPVTTSGTLTGSWATTPTGSGAMVRATSPTIASATLTAPIISTPSSGISFSGTSGATVVQASSAASGTLTLPTATDTVVARATTDTLTNKTISGASNTISSIANGSLTNSSITIGGSAVSLGSTATFTTLTNSLGADVALNNSANYFDGPVVAQGTSGTWFVSGTVTLSDTTPPCQVYCKLWDGTTVIASTLSSCLSGTGVSTASLSGFITNPAGNLRISCRDISTTTGSIKFNATANSKDSTITAIRIG